MARETDAELRAELQEAIATVRHQIEVQSTANHYVGGEGITEGAIGELQVELARLEEALRSLN